MSHPLTRRRFLTTLGLAGAALPFMRGLGSGDTDEDLAASNRALFAITLDLEMSRNFPTWEQTHWDYEKGNLNDDAKKYTVEACRRVKKAGGVLHTFVVGRVFEQESVDWLRGLVQEGHPVGNHTYDHVNVLATRMEDVQFRFRRAPWLVSGKKPEDVIRENIRLTSAALKTRVGVDPAGFRTPGGFDTGLKERPDVRRMLRNLGFTWVSSLYPRHPLGKAEEEPTPAIYEGIVKAQTAAQPFVYDDGLIEVPMSPISDITAFRSGRWKLPWFLDALKQAAEWVIAERAVFDFLAHPSCLYVVDPEFKAIDLLCELVRKAGKRAAITDLDTMARRAQLRHKPRK